LEFNNESKLSNSIALRSEIGIEHDFTVGDHYDNAGLFFQPVPVEPRILLQFRKTKTETEK
jgi:hypothetical protein